MASVHEVLDLIDARGHQATTLLMRERIFELIADNEKRIVEAYLMSIGRFEFHV